MSDYSNRWSTANTTEVKSEKRFIAKVYSNTGYIISRWDNVKSWVTIADKIYLTLDGDKDVTIYGGIIVIEEV